MEAECLRATCLPSIWQRLCPKSEVPVYWSNLRFCVPWCYVTSTIQTPDGCGQSLARDRGFVLHSLFAFRFSLFAFRFSLSFSPFGFRVFEVAMMPS